MYKSNFKQFHICVCVYLRLDWKERNKTAWCVDIFLHFQHTTIQSLSFIGLLRLYLSCVVTCDQKLCICLCMCVRTCPEMPSSGTGWWSVWSLCNAAFVLAKFESSGVYVCISGFFFAAVCRKIAIPYKILCSCVHIIIFHEIVIIPWIPNKTVVLPSFGYTISSKFFLPFKPLIFCAYCVCANIHISSNGFSSPQQISIYREKSYRYILNMQGISENKQKKLFIKNHRIQNGWWNLKIAFLSKLPFHLRCRIIYTYFFFYWISQTMIYRSLIHMPTSKSWKKGCKRERKETGKRALNIYVACTRNKYCDKKKMHI